MKSPYALLTEIVFIQSNRNTANTPAISARGIPTSQNSNSVIVVPEVNSFTFIRGHGDPEKSEFTIVKFDAYKGINQYLSDLTCTNIKTVEESVRYNSEDRGPEGAYPSDQQAFPSGQDNFHEVVESKGKRDSTYLAALNHIQTHYREHGIDAALNHTAADGKTIKLDALLLCDRLGLGQQIAAQADYPIISIPIGLDDEGLPVGLSLQHTAWEEATLIKWASAIESVVRGKLGWRPTPTYHNHLAKNIPIL